MLSDYFTDTELGIIPLVAAGMTNQTIGRLTYRTESTIKTHVVHMIEKQRRILESGFFGKNARTALAGFCGWFIEAPSDESLQAPSPSSRRMTVATYLPYGATNLEIGQACGLSPLTIKTHMSCLLADFGEQMAREAVAYQVARLGMCGRPLPSQRLLRERHRWLRERPSIAELIYDGEELSQCVSALELASSHALPLALYRSEGDPFIERYRHSYAREVADFQAHHCDAPWVPLLCRGWTLPQIARRLGQNEATVESEMRDVMERYELENLVSVTLLAVAAQ